MDRSEAWPQQLEGITGLSVYNLAFGGYGPVQHSVLLETGLELDPGLVIEAFYAGNDLYDSFELVYGTDQYADLRSPDGAVLEQIQHLEQTDPLAAKVARHYKKAKPPRTPGILERHSKLYALGDAIRRALKRGATSRS